MLLQKKIVVSVVEHSERKLDVTGILMSHDDDFILLNNCFVQCTSPQGTSDNTHRDHMLIPRENIVFIGCDDTPGPQQSPDECLML